MNIKLISVLLGLAIAGAVGGAEVPPIPVVPQNSKALVGVPRPQNDKTCQERFRRFNEQAKAGGFDVLFIGDSITHCWEAHGKEVWEKKIAPFNAVNFGIGGDTTETVIWRLDHGNLDGALDPKVVVLMIGTNNSERDKPEETAAGIGAILERLHKRLPKAKLLLFGIFPRQAPDSPQRKVNDAVNRIIAKYDGHWNIKYIDITPKMTDGQGKLLPGLSWDGLHLTAKGYDVWADVLVQELQAVLGSKTNELVTPRLQTHLWDKEPALWDAAKKFQLVQPIPTVFGEQESSGMGINISNERLQSSLWGRPERFVLSLGKADVWNRAKLNPFSGKKPVGQIQILADDLAGAAQPVVRTSIHDGNNVFCVTQGVASASYQVLLTPCDSNVIAIKAACTHLVKPLAVRLYRHRDKHNDLPEPQGGSDGTFFWIHQQFPAEKTFPDGFDYYLVAKIAGATGTVAVENMKTGLGASVPFRGDEVPGSAATLSISPGEKRDFTIYATVVTRAESAEPLSEAKRRLKAAEERGYTGLLQGNEKWYRSLYERRERGRIFTGEFDDVKGVVLPFFYEGSYQSRHIGFSNPDPTKFESDAAYNQLENDEVRWCGLQCFNEELYTGDFVAGRDESVTPYYVNVFDMYRPIFEGYARERGFDGLLVLRGYVPPIKMDRYWSPDYPANSRQECDWATLVWSFKNVWDTYDYGGRDEEFLKEQVYPSLRGIADLFASIVKLGADGCYHLEPSQIREEDIGRDAVDCIAAAKWAFKRAIETSQRLGVDEARRKVWTERLGKMAPYYIIENDRKEKVFASLVKAGRPVVAGHGTTHFIVNVADEINLDSSEEEKQMAIRSNMHAYGQPMNRQVEFLLGKMPDALCMTSVFANPPWLIHYAKQSGTGDYSKVLPLETQVQKAIACWLEPERLCNSRSGIIHFFPCVPSNFNVAFKDFQARGGFLVTGELKGGVVTCARIQARRDGECRLINPWPGCDIRIREVQSGAAVAMKKDGNRCLFQAVAGKEYEFFR